MPATKRNTKSSTKRKTVTKKPKVFKIEVNHQDNGVELSSRKRGNSQIQLSQEKKNHSKYVVNLKKISHEREISAHAKLSYAEKLKNQFDVNIENVHEKIHLAQDWLNELPQKNISHSKKTYFIQQENTSVHEVSVPQESSLQTKKRVEFKKIISGISLPKLNIPKIEISLPKLPNFSNPFSSYTRRALASFILASFIITSPLLSLDYYQKAQYQKGQVLGMATNAISHLKAGKEVLALEDFDSAKIELSQAFADFLRARQELDALPAVVNALKIALPQGKALDTANYLLDLAIISSRSGSEIVDLISDDSGLTLTERLKKINDILIENKNTISELSDDASDISLEYLPSEYQAQIAQILSILPVINQNADKIISINANILKILGGEQSKRYMLIFQNNAEIRANGGFIGSYAIVDIDQGVIKNLDIPAGGTYDLKGQLKTSVQPPAPISLLNPRWEIQDANWFADYKQSAEKISWFYRQSGGTSVDGVIAINSSILGEILKLTGPIALSNPQITLDSNNVTDIIQEMVENGSDKENNQPKRILSELIPTVLNKLLKADKKSFLGTIKVLTNALVSKDILLYFTEPELQELAESRRLAGKILPTDGDYLSVVSSNIAGSKSSTSIEDKILSKTEITSDGQLTRTIEITRVHKGDPSSPLRGVKNNDYIRFMVPFGSKLIEANGFEPITTPETTQRDIDQDLAIIASTKATDAASGTEIYSEAGKTVFANWIQINPGEQKAVSLKYLLPFKMDQNDFKTYKILVQPQPGNKNQTFNFVIDTASKYKFVWAYPSQISAVDSKHYIAKDLKFNTDSILGIVFE